jgi:hypothetical protein
LGLWDPRDGAPDPSRSYKSGYVVEAVRKAAPKRVIVPYTKRSGLRLDTRVAPDPGKPA